jgi:hypothetical protein
MAEGGQERAASRALDEGHVRSFAFMLGGPRPGGSSERLARRAAVGLCPEAERSWLPLSGLPLPGSEGFGPSSVAAEDGHLAVEGHEKLLLDATLEHTDIVMVSPLYWYSVSAQTKLYLDYWARWMSRPEPDFRNRMRGKTLWAVSTFARGSVHDAEPLVGMFRRTACYLDMSWGGALLHQVRSTGESADLDAAHEVTTFFGAVRLDMVRRGVE